MNKILVAMTALAFLSTPALAQDLDFASVDANQDGQVSYDEATAVMPDLTQDQYNAADTDQNGTLSEDEYNAMLDQMDSAN